MPLRYRVAPGGWNGGICGGGAGNGGEGGGGLGAGGGGDGSGGDGGGGKGGGGSAGTVDYRQCCHGVTWESPLRDVPGSEPDSVGGGGGGVDDRSSTGV